MLTYRKFWLQISIPCSRNAFTVSKICQNSITYHVFGKFEPKRVVAVVNFRSEHDKRVRLSRSLHKFLSATTHMDQICWWEAKEDTFCIFLMGIDRKMNFSIWSQTHITLLNLLLSWDHWSCDGIYNNIKFSRCIRQNVALWPQSTILFASTCPKNSFSIRVLCDSLLIWSKNCKLLIYTYFL